MRLVLERIQVYSLLRIFLVCLLNVACAGKYLVKSYPADAKLYIKDLRTNEKKLIGNTPAKIDENSKLGEVFFLVLEKENYKTKEVMVKINEGESLTVAARLDPIVPGDGSEQSLAAKKDDNKPQPGSPKPDGEPRDWQKEIEDLKLRVALLENTTSFTKDALFSPRMTGGLPGQDRDRKETVVSLVFEAQKSIMTGQLDQALEHIDKALLMDDYSTNAWLLKGSIKYLKKDYAGARFSWERTMKLDPYNKVAFKYLNSVYKILNMEPLAANAADMRVPASTLEINRRQSKMPNLQNSK